MLDAAYLRHQADACVRIARTSFDLTTAERLRFMAADLRAKADELEDAQDSDAREPLEPHMMTGNGKDTAQGSSDRG